MALTIAANSNGYNYPFGGMAQVGPYRFVPVTITPDSSYATGGESVRVSGSPVQEAGKIVGFCALGGNAAAAKYSPFYDTANEKLLFYKGFAGATEMYAPGGGDIKGATNQAGTEGNADQNATAVNGALLLAADTFTNLAGTMTPTTQPDVARNIVVQIENDSGGALDLYEGATVFTITGTLFGVAQTDTITLTSTAGNKSVADTKFRFIQSSKAFSTVTTVTYDNAPAGALKGSLGVGTRLAIPGGLETGTHTDVKHFTVSAARIATGATATSAGGVDTTNNTINTGTTADGADVGIVYNIGANEVASGTDLSGITVDGFFVVWG